MCISPYAIKRRVKDPQGEHKPDVVPCGKCPVCRSRRVNQWLFRLQIHTYFSKSAEFWTLTYDDEHLPATEDGLPTLLQEHMQQFFKRLRHDSHQKITYVYCGEYGKANSRPHYHALLFNHSGRDIHHRYNSVNKAWSKGHVHVGQVNDASIRYILKYMLKSSETFDDGRQDEYQRMSRGIGSQYVDEKMRQFMRKNPKGYVYHKGFKVALPRYYKELICRDQYAKSSFSSSSTSQDIQSEANQKCRAEATGIIGEADHFVGLRGATYFDRYQWKKTLRDEAQNARSDDETSTWDSDQRKDAIIRKFKKRIDGHEKNRWL